MVRYISLPPIAALAFAVAAFAVASSPALAIGECRGQFIQTSQGYEFGTRRPSLVKAGAPAKAGTEAIFVGESTIRGRVYFSAASSHMYPGADVQLQTGCRLMHLDASEPD